MNGILYANESKSFAVESSGKLIPSIQVNFTGNASMLVYQREGTVPWIPDAYDVKQTLSNSIVLILNPRTSSGAEFDTMFTVEDSNSDSLEYAFSAFLTPPCASDQAGDACQYHLHTLSSAPVVVSPKDLQSQWYIASISLTLASAWSVGVTPLNGQQAPQIFVRYGNIPTFSQFDACHNVSTTGSRYYFTGPTLTNSVWYLGLYVPANGDFVVWLNQVCPNGCSGHGSCIANTCKCFEGYHGWDCSEASTTFSNVLRYSAALPVVQVIILEK
jgi:hypothetical protein